MTEKRKLFRKIWDGTWYFFNPKNSPYLKHIKERYDGELEWIARLKAKKGRCSELDYFFLKCETAYILQLSILPVFGLVFCLCGIGELAGLLKEEVKPKVEYVQKVDKHLKKFNKNPFEKLDAQDLVLEHYFYPQAKNEEYFPFVKKNIPVEKPNLLAINQKVRE